jgi:hypothetical protein
MRDSLRSRASAALAGAVLCLAVTACGSSGPTGLQVTLTAPTDGATVSVGEIFVVGNVNMNGASVVVNGRPAHMANGYFSEQLRLHRGVNHIGLVASATGVATQASRITVLYKPARGSAGQAAPTGNARPGSFAWRVNAVCTNLNNQFVTLPQMTSVDAIKSDIRAMLNLDGQALTQLQGITAPRSKAARFRDFLAIERSQLALLRQGIDAATNGQPQVLLGMVQELQASAEKQARIAEQLGLTECTTAVFPSG